VVLIEPGAFKTDIWDRNVRIGEVAISKDSPNPARRFRAIREEASKCDAIHVARLIVRTAQDPNPKLLYMIGFDAHVAALVTHVNGAGGATRGLQPEQ
jgi:hypothetical protein